jgi:hypothetical protein
MTTAYPSSRVTAPIGAFVDGVREAVGRGLPPDVTAYLVGERLAPYLGAPDLLTPAQREGDPDGYRQHVLHVEPVDTRHPEIEKEAGGPVVERTLEKFAGAFEDFDDEAVAAQNARDASQHERVVIDDEHAKGVFHPPGIEADGKRR